MICLVTVSRLVLVRTTNSRSNKLKSITRLELNTVRRFLLLYNNVDYARLKESALPSSIISGLSEAGPLDSRGLYHFRDGEEERERGISRKRREMDSRPRLSSRANRYLKPL